MTVWLQVWWILAHGLFSQTVYPFPGPTPVAPPIPLTGALVWWSADFGSNCSGMVCNDGDSQDTFADRSGNGNNGVLSIGGTPCVATIYHTNQINGMPADTYNGVNTDPGKSCFGVSFAGLDNKSAVTWFLAMKQNASNQAIMAGNNNSLSLQSVGGSQGVNKNCVAAIGTSTSAGDTSWHQFNFTYDAGTGAYAFRRDRSADGSGTNSQTITGNWLLLGSNIGCGGVATLNGQIAEFIMYNRVLTGGEITTVETYLNGKYGL